MTPFSYESRQEIGKNEKWQCACGRNFASGYMVHASHYDHDRDSGYYDNPENGCIQCVMCHLRTHIELMLEDDNAWSFNSTRLLAMGIWRDGIHTRAYYRGNPEQILEDREELLAIFDEYGLPVETFVPMVCNGEE